MFTELHHAPMKEKKCKERDSRFEFSDGANLRLGGGEDGECSVVPTH